MRVTAFIVEDQSLAAQSLTDLLTAMGVEVIAIFDSESEATKWLAEHRGEWNVAIIDLSLGRGGSGCALIPLARKECPEGKIVVFSSYAMESVAERCRALGTDTVFSKNDLSALLRYIESLQRDCAAAP